MGTDTERELVDLSAATTQLHRAREVPSSGTSSALFRALMTLEALIAEAHVARRAVATRAPDVTELVNTVIDAAGRMLETVADFSSRDALADQELTAMNQLVRSQAERIADLENSVSNLETMRTQEREGRDEQFARAEKLARQVVEVRASAQHHIDELRDEIKTRASQAQFDAQLIARLNAELETAHKRERDFEDEIHVLSARIEELTGNAMLRPPAGD